MSVVVHTVSMFVDRIIHADFSTRCLWKSARCTKLRCICTTGQRRSTNGDVTSLTD